MDRQWMLILLGVLTSTRVGAAFPLSVKKCALPMTSVAIIGFRTPIGPPDGDEKQYNNTQYIFDELRCDFEGVVGDGEAYHCKTGNILQSLSWNLGDRNLLSDRGGVICRTKKQPKVEPNANIRFICDDTESVLPTVSCKDTDECLIAPMSYKRFVIRFFQNIEKLRGLIGSAGDIRLFKGEYKFECPTYFDCFWWKCSGLLISGKDIKDDAKYMGRALECILKAPVELTSLEIMNTNESLLPDTICQYTTLQQLALANNRIKELPTCMKKMVKLKILDASWNSLERIGELSFGSEQLQTLVDLSFNNISYIEQNAFSKMRNLSFLALNSNLLKDITFFLPESIIYLDLSHNKISILPSFQTILKLQVLHLQHNKIESTDFNIPVNLKHLDLSFNQIGFVDSAMFKNAVNLGALNLNSNRIKIVQVPWENLLGGSLDMLKNLTISNNLIENLDESLTRLEHVDLSQNQIESIDLGLLKKANNLKTLLLQYNKINEIQDNIISGNKEITILPNMRYMNLSHNNLEVAPLSLIFLMNLQEIDFSYNRIEKCTWSNMPKEDIFTNIDKWLGGHRNYQKRNRVVLTFNNIKSLKDVFKSEKIMVYKNFALFSCVHIGENPFRCDCNLYPYLRLFHDHLVQTAQNRIDDYRNTSSITTQMNSTSVSFHSYMLHVCDTPFELKHQNVFDKDILEKLTCKFRPQKEYEVIYQPSASLLIANFSHLNIENTRTLHLDQIGLLLHKLSKGNLGLPIGLNVKIYLSGMNFGNADILNPPKTLLISIHLVKRFLAGKIILLDLSHSNISDGRFLKKMSKDTPHLTHLFLNDNNLTTLNLESHILHFENETHPTQNATLHWDKVTELHLYNNPWECSCHTKWMKKWLGKLIILKILIRRDEIRCATPEKNRGKIVHLLEDEYFCEDPTLTYLAKFAGSSYVQTVFLIVLILPLWFYPHFSGRETPSKMRAKTPLSRDNVGDDDDLTEMEFDAFVSYCEADSEWVENEFVPYLEGHDPPYKVCQHKRDFVPGRKSYENEQHAITCSRRTIIIMSSAYLKSKHCMYEFESAYSHWIVTKDSPRLAVVKYPDVDCTENKNETCSAYFRHFTYVAKDENTIASLLKFMPRKSLGQNSTVNDNTDSADLFMQVEDESLALRQDIEQADNEGPCPNGIPTEDEVSRMLEESELEAAERAEAGEEISAEKIFQQKWTALLNVKTE